MAGKINKILNQNKNLTLRKTRIIGNLLFDGSLYLAKDYHYGIMYVNCSLPLVKEFCEDINYVYGLKPSIYKEKSKKSLVYRAKQHSKLIYYDLLKYIKSYSTSNRFAGIPDEIINGSRNIQLEFMRTFWNNEGSILYNGRLRGTSNSLSIIKQLRELHDNFGFNCRIYQDNNKQKPSYILALIKTKENLNKFHKYNLFTEAIVVYGHNKGMKKSDILKQFI